METPTKQSIRDAAIIHQIKMGVPPRIVAKKHGLHKDHVCRIVRRGRLTKLAQPIDTSLPRPEADSMTPAQWKARRLAKIEEASRKAGK